MTGNWYLTLLDIYSAVLCRVETACGPRQQRWQSSDARLSGCVKSRTVWVPCKPHHNDLQFAQFVSTTNSFCFLCIFSLHVLTLGKSADLFVLFWILLTLLLTEPNSIVQDCNNMCEPWMRCSAVLFLLSSSFTSPWTLLRSWLNCEVVWRP